MAFILNSIVYDSAGQTSISFFSQHHQLFVVNPKISFNLITSLNFFDFLTNFLFLVKSFFLFSLGDTQVEMDVTIN